jgi:NADH-quinone oxidoreductase subunit L
MGAAPPILLTIVLAPLVASIVVGLFGGRIGRVGAHRLCILGVGVATGLSFWVLGATLLEGYRFDGSVYTWAVIGDLHLEVGFLIDRLTALMMAVVSFVSLMVHIYTIGYMAHDEENWPDGSGAGANSYQRFFAYISLFTFSMLMLVMSNNFLQLFFGWEAVGLVSYLLIGFWSVRETAIFANLKAFLVNRVGDFGFLLGIAAIYSYTGSLNYQEVFGAAPGLRGETLMVMGATPWSVLTFICLGLFIGAMGKSAQVPLHVWLPDSMEGPTPISALIHAATMVTAGIFMVARMSPLFELSETALAAVLAIGALTAFSMGLLGLVQHDIKRVIAYSTLSQLGYMTVALGVSAYGAAIFHLMTHAFFKALLFLAAGSVIIALHHEQDMRKMGGLKKYMPITYWTSLVGSLALIGFPGFSGFFSKDAIIEAVHHSEIAGAGIAYYAVLGGVFITALYTFRLMFLVFHGEERMDAHAREHCKESPWVVTLPLVLLAIPSLLIGFFTAGPVLFGDYYDGAIQVAASHDVLALMAEEWQGPLSFMLHGLTGPAFMLALAGIATAWFLYLRRPDLPARIATALGPLYQLLVQKYFFDWFNEQVIARMTRGVGWTFWKVGDVLLIDGLAVNGSADLVGVIARRIRRVQSGYLYHYAFAMVLGLSVLLGWMVWF